MARNPDTGLASSHVRLRALTTDDREVLRSFINDPEVLALSNVFRPISDVQQDAWFRAAVTGEHQTWFGIEKLAPPELIGTCCLVDIDWVGRVAELRIRIGDKQAWGASLGRQACGLLVEFGFRHLNLERIWLRVFAPNTRALRMYEKLGFVVEGRLRRAWHLRGVTDDVIVMGLLRDEWQPPR
ncbi:MAG: GNAT family N-acetyltransferase [Deltaproteobacteria bacterium]|nr:GNAT family N-acetyltransferase [Deltaproteobacteria bacterium]